MTRTVDGESGGDGRVGDHVAGHAGQQAAGRAGAFGLFERQLALRYLRAKRADGGVALIAIIAFIGVMLGAFGLIATMSVMNGFSHIFFSQIIGVQPHVTIDSRGLSAEAREAMVAELASVDGVVRVTPMVQQTVLAKANGVTEAAIVIGVPPEKLHELDLVSDTLIPVDTALAAFQDEAVNDDIILVGCGVARRFGLIYRLPLDFVPDDPDAAEPCGQLPNFQNRLELIAPTTRMTPFSSAPKRKAYDVAGVFRIGNGDIDGRFVFMDIAQAQVLLGRGASVDRLAIFVEDPISLPRFERLLTDQDLARMTPFELSLRRIGGMYGLASWRDEYAAYETALKVERTMMRIILSILLIITAMNIISGLVMLAKNKGRDIAVLRTMGATRSSIMRVFLMIGALIGFLGTLTGLGLGALFAVYITPIQQFVEWITGATVFDESIYGIAYLPARLAVGEVVFVLVWGFFLACLAALPPAWNAARQDPVEALRNE